MKKHTAWAALLGLLLAVPAQAASTHFHGVNIAGAEFNSGALPGIAGKNYIWPTAADIDAYAAIGANIVRMPFLWERMQPVLGQPLDANELARLDAVVAAAASRGVTILLDVHNYGGYRGENIGSEDVPVAAFADLWTRLAEHEKGNANVAFGLMNEPHKIDAAVWAAIAQAGIDAIRKTGAQQLILVPGTDWSGAHSWISSGNAAALQTIKDPAHNFVFEMHQYFDKDSSGTHPECVSADVGEKALAAATAWLHKTGNRAFLGEFGASKDPVCLEALRGTLAYMAANKDVWYGWTYWAAGAWFGTYMFNIYPPDPARYPQVEILEQAMSGKE
ncbi:MAG: glycoside hydrolase family 5 protein [Alphaproteobacteria bacterium]|nr:glycoside hydrolase family 5 protein [Alphaproteobacteria bacterium]